MNNIKNAYLTTKDNPYSYFKQPDEWLAFDESNGYNTNALVARIVGETSPLYDIDRVNDYIEEAYFTIASAMPDLYEIRYE